MAFVPGSIAGQYALKPAKEGGFVPGSIASKVKTTPTTGGFVPGSVASKYGSAKPDLNTVEGLKAFAESKGLDVSKIVDETPKLSFLGRLSAGLSAFNPANAIATSIDKGGGLLGATIQYPIDVAKGLGSAITGNDYQADRKYFRDIAEKAGVENGVAKFGIGFVGDVLLDPTTYFGGAIVKGIAKGASAVTNTSLKTVGKVAPGVEAGLRMTGTGAKEAFGRAFVPGFKASEGALTDTLTFLSKRDKAKIGLAASNLNRLGTGVLTKDQSQELALKLVGGKRAEFMAREAGTAVPKVTSADPMVQKVIESQNTRSKRFADQLNLQNPYENYFPFLKKDKVDFFVKQINSSGIRVGSEGYRKQFKNVMTNENLELNPAKAFFTSEAQQVTDRMSRNFLHGFVQKYGKPLETFSKESKGGSLIPDVDAAAKAGFKLLKEGMFGREIGFIPEYDAKLLRDLINPEYQTVNMLAKATGFDAITSLFKRSVTGLFLPFHVRNFASGMIQNFEALGPAALNPKTITAGLKLALHLARDTKPAEGIINVAGKSTKMSQVFKAFVDRFGSDTFYHNDFAQAADMGSILKSQTPILSSESLKETAKTLGLGADAIPFRMGRAVGQYIEHQQKATAYLTALGQGKNIPEALKAAEAAGFDYRSLTAFESQILRRLIPFYSFTRKNIELQMRTLGENPQRVNQIMAFFKNMGDQPDGEEKKSLPDYIKNSLGIKLEDTPDGLKQYISSFGTPVEAFTSLINGNPVLMALSMTNPILKAPIELGVGKDSFRQKDLKDVYDAKEYSAAPKWVKDLLEIKEAQKPILKEGADGKLHKTGERTVYVANPERLLIARSLFTSRGVTYLDQVFDGDLQGLVKYVKLTTGIKPQQIDIEMQKGLKERDQRRAIEDLLQKMGDISVYSNAYVPKNR